MTKRLLPTQLAEAVNARVTPRAGLGAALGWLVIAYAAGFVLVPFLASPVFPSQDGPAHLHTATLLAGLRAGTSPTAALLLHEAFPGLTNIAAYWLLSRLLDVLSPIRAEWTMALLLSLMLLGVVLAAPRLLGGRMVDAAFGLLLCAPMMLQMGSFALVLATVPGFLALVFAARLVRGGGAADAAAFGVLSLLGCALQIQAGPPLIAAAFGGAAGAAGWRWLRGGGFVVPRGFLLLVVASLPALGACLAYALSKSPEHAAHAVKWSPLVQAAALALRGDVVWFSVLDPVLLTLATATVAAGALLWLLRAQARPIPSADAAQRQGEWLIFGTLAIAGAAMVLPRETAAVPQITERMASFAQFSLYLWFVVTPLPTRWRSAALVTAVVAGLALTASRGIGHALVERRLVAELAWAESQIRDHQLMAQVRIPSILEAKGPALRLGGLSLRFDPAAHTGRGISGRDVVALSNYQLMPIWGLFRVEFRSEVEAAFPIFTELSVMIEDGHLRDGFQTFQSRLRGVSGRELETIILWNGGFDPAEAAARNPNLAAFLREMEAGFHRTGRSPAGLAEIWERNPGR